ncbi:MAG: hypothetical protein GY943_39490 [Chloroflexi bacterium]|nr:hypothetical protein [Chloroflexota bacterium]
MEIIPRQGIGNIKFGMNPFEVKEIMGSQLIWEEWMGGNNNDALYYPGLVFVFDKNDGRGPVETAQLIEIWTNESADLVFAGKKISETKKYQMEQILRSKDLSIVLREDEIYVNSCGLEMAFHKDGRFDRLWLYKI